MPIHRLSAAVLVLCCAACSPPAEPPQQTPPEPQATELRDAIQEPIDKARAVEAAVHDAAKAQQAQIEAAGQ